MGIEPAQAIAMGDGANDLPMMGVAGLSVAYHAKPKVREQAKVAIDMGGLDRLLEVFRAEKSAARSRRFPGPSGAQAGSGTLGRPDSAMASSASS